MGDQHRGMYWQWVSWGIFSIGVIGLVGLSWYGFESYQELQQVREKHRELRRKRVNIREDLRVMRDRIWHLKNDPVEIERELRRELYYIGPREYILVEDLENGFGRIGSSGTGGN